MSKQDDQKSWLDKIGDALSREPQDKNDLLNILQDAHDRKLLDKDQLVMIEGVLQVSQRQARDIMIPRAQMVMIEEGTPLQSIIPIISESGHSRFPVINEEHSQIGGILLAKDLVSFASKKKADFDLQTLLRPVHAIPESKRLDSLLQEFKHNHNHMAIVIDEYGGIAGLITIEDVLEQIVGNIEDEFDTEDESYITQVNHYEYLVRAITPITTINDFFKLSLNHEDMDTIGGLILVETGHLPQEGERINLRSFHVEILKADERRIHLIRVIFPHD